MMLKEHISAVKALLSRTRFSIIFVILLTMALAGGLVVSLIHWHAIAPLPYKHADRLVWLHGEMLDRRGEVIMDKALSNIAAQYIASHDSQLGLVAPIFYGEGLFTSHQEQPKINVTYTHPNFFTLFGLNLLAGQYFNAQPTENKGLREVVVSACFANRYMHNRSQGAFAASNILFQSIELDTENYRVVGVVECSNAEPQLSAANHQTDIFMDFGATINYDQPLLEHLSVRYETFVVGRLEEGKNIKPVAPELVAHLNQKFSQGLVSFNHGKDKLLTFTYSPLHNRLKGLLKSTSNWLLLGGVAFLLITLVNLFVFYLLDFKKQQSELALKVTLGAKLKTLRGAHFIQLGVLFLISALGATLVAELSVHMIKQVAAKSFAHMGWLDISWWQHSLMVVSALTLSFVFAQLGFSQLSFRHLHSQMHGGSKGQTKQLPQWLTVNVLIIQLCLGTVVLCLAIWSSIFFIERLLTPTGIDHADVMFIERQQRSWSREAEQIDSRKQVYLANERALISHPKVASVALSAITPFNTSYVASIGKSPQSVDQITINSQLVGAGYFELLTQRVVAGRVFTEQDSELRNVLIINRKAALLMGIDEHDIGITLYPGKQSPITLIGIVENTFTHTTGSLPILYFPHDYYETNILVKFKSGQSMSKSEVVKILKQQETTQNVQELTTLSALINELNKTAILSLVGGIGLSILIVAQVVVGLFGLLGNLAYSQRAILLIKQQVGAKHRQLMREQVLLRLGHFAVALVIATSVILVIANVVSVSLSILLFSYTLSVILVFSLLFFIDLYHVYKQLKKD
ncbi:ABC transporter permease [Pseudoalteromonas luteoviolacea]|nr:ABC transporter permease [Pseudoalteromonas luteoviolacea]